ncbi:alpha/beta-hydrolase [Calocera viscosa TUFC12733]|uniref:Carboxypeptidase n=1 Tax=Calocera viscosa (strain TUFC12733) TaxID=1330018 RepID=A0A167MKB7_CALVF|nr:alpha/beta-hydrolase [Calocera viscosa TUFC12733]
MMVPKCCRLLCLVTLLLHAACARHVPVVGGVIAGVAGLVPRAPTVWTPLASLLAGLHLQLTAVPRAPTVWTPLAWLLDGLGATLNLNLTLAAKPHAPTVWTPLPLASLLAGLGIKITAAVPPTPSLARRALDPSNITVGSLQYVENSGVCETTPGVYQASGYGEIATNQSLFFWYFASRSGEDTAPLSIWFNGGPGSSSMLGLFQEMGPCRVTSDGLNYTHNPYAWNNFSNMLFIDQPVGVGFSYGEMSANSSQSAAADLWTFMQVFLSDKQFSKLANNSFAIWTESYGGHYGPAFAYRILQQNAAIDAGVAKGIKLNLTTLGIGNGLINPLVQYPSYTTYATSNPYNVTLANSTVISNATYSLYVPGGCMDLIGSCYATQSESGQGNDVVCSQAQQVCNQYVLTPLVGGYDEYDIRRLQPDPYPPNLTHLLHDPTLLAAIGVPSYVNWTQTSQTVYDKFAQTGDWMTNSAPYLESVIDSGVRVTMYDGDADYICNYQGFEAVADALLTRFSTLYTMQNFTNWTVAGQPAGQYKNAGPLSFVRVAGAGHEVPAYGINGSLAEGQAALSFFEQTMQGLPISNT